MSKVCTVVVNGEAFSANCGDLLLDAALMNGIDIPHDCRAGICGTCRVRVLDGLILAGRAEDPEAVYACQFPVVSDLTVAVENVPEITTVNGQVFDLIPLASDVVEVSIALPQASEYLPGQYYKVEFRGFPARCYSPAAPMGGRVNDRMIRLHVRRLPDGRVSSALGRSIRKRHRVKLTGPFGSAYFRPSGPPSRPHRLVLVAGGTGFAPLWSIAYAAMNEWAERELVLVVGARRLESLYMIPALSARAGRPIICRHCPRAIWFTRRARRQWSRAWRGSPERLAPGATPTHSSPCPTTQKAQDCFRAPSPGLAAMAESHRHESHRHESHRHESHRHRSRRSRDNAEDIRRRAQRAAQRANLLSAAIRA
jgi:3-phenylpropionate/trans-cinnamate dioxygenase ferredoxin reductase subunit